MTAAIPSYTEKTWAGDGVTTAFPFATRTLEAADLKVWLVENDTATLKSLTTHYGLSGLGEDAGVTVTFVVPPPSGQTVKVRRETLAKQTVDYEDLNKVPGATTEEQLDRLAMAAQDNSARLNQVEDIANASALIEDFDKRYLGAFSSDPTTDNDGEALLAGTLYFSTTIGKMRVWSGAAWQDQSIALNDGDVTVNKLAPGAVTDAKVADSFRAKIVGIAANRAALAAMNGAAYLAVDLMETGRKGLFYWDGSDLSGTLQGTAITSTSVNSSTETITKAAHGLWTGQPVVVTSAVNGLALNTVYYAIRVSIDTFRLASSFVNAIDEVAFNLTGTTNFTVKRHYDPLQIAYVTPPADISGASGAWVRQFDGKVHLNWAGLTAAGDEKDNIHAGNMAVIFADRRGCGVGFPGYQFDAYAGPNGGIRILSNTRLQGSARAQSILNGIGGGTISQCRNYQAGSVICRHFDFTGGTNAYVQKVLIERLGVVLNHPSASVTTTDIQIGIDLRNVTRSIVRENWVGNYHPDPAIDSKGFTRPYLAQGYGIVCGNESGDVSYAGGEVNVIENNDVHGLWRAICIDDNLLTPTSAAYSTRVERNDVSVASVLVFQGSQYGAGNVIRHNVLQATQAQQGSAHPDGAMLIEGYGNLIEECYGEYGTDCPFILRFGGPSHNNRAKYSGTCSVTGGVLTEGGVHYGFRDAAGATSDNVIEFYADSSGGGGSYIAFGSPQRMISGTSTTQT